MCRDQRKTDQKNPREQKKNAGDRNFSIKIKRFLGYSGGLAGLY